MSNINNNFYGYLEELCKLNGGSGDEKNVREYIIDKIDNINNSNKIYDYLVDALGNLIVTKTNADSNNKKIMLAAHMDEVSMIITAIRDDGLLNISSVGGIEADVAIGRRVVVNGKKCVVGVIGSRAVHNMSDDDKDKKPKFSKLYLDIGADNKEEAEKLVDLGDRVYFQPNYEKFGDGFIKTKAIDDRFGCAVLLHLLHTDILESDYNYIVVFSTQEELGLRGITAALGNAIISDVKFALVIEATTAADIPDVSGEKRCCELGGGAVVPFMDKVAVYDKELYNLSKKLASDNNIKWQTKTVIAGGNDSGVVHTANGGIKTLSISAPCRYIHSPNSVVKQSDLDDCLNLVKVLIQNSR